MAKRPIMSHGQHEPGLTRTVGFQIGVRRALPMRAAEAWQLLTSGRGLALWLGASSGFDVAKGALCELADGTVGEVRAHSPGSHLSIGWRPPGWARASVLQLRVIPRGDKTVIAFHQEHLPDAKEREDRRLHFTRVLDELVRLAGDRPIRSSTGGPGGGSPSRRGGRHA